MNCVEAETHFSGLLTADLNSMDRIALLAHLETCPACAEAFAGLVELAARLDRLPPEKPSPALRERFYQMLEQATHESHPRSRWNGKGLALAAALLLLVGGGFAGGYWIRGGNEAENPALNQNLALLRQSGQGLRMAGIMLASQGDPEDAVPAEALLDLLDRDPSESVRLAAVDALYLYGRQPHVRQRLAEAMARQTSPRVQLALVDLLGGLREQRALEALRTLLHAPGTTPEVARRVRIQLKAQPL